MKAAQLFKYNKNDLTLTFSDIETADLGPNDVLLKSLAAGVNPVDNMIIRGEVKMIVPYKTPVTLGNEIVGEVLATGSNVKQFKKGDRLFGRMPLDNTGAFAENVVVNADALAKVPDYLSNEEAAAVPLTALTATQALDLMTVEAGKTIFISGATGGFGAMAIPIAKAKGLKVIVNGNGQHKERLLALGADQFIDYKVEDYVDTLSNIDYVIDTLGGDELAKQIKILKKGGQVVSLRAMPNGAFAKRMGLPKIKQFLFGMVGRKFDQMASKEEKTYHFIFVHEDGKQLQEVANLFEKLQLKPSVEAVYPFEEVNKALDKVANGHAKGKTVITFN